MRRDNFISPIRGLYRRSRGRLPHWEVDDADYSVTFRLRDSLPPDVIHRLVLERAHLAHTAHNAAERAEIDRQFGLGLDSYLDAGYGSCILKDHAEVVADALRYFDGT